MVSKCYGSVIKCVLFRGRATLLNPLIVPGVHEKERGITICSSLKALKKSAQKTALCEHVPIRWRLMIASRILSQTCSMGSSS